jgi:multiple sugar transport system ATP-binding protein
MVAIVVDKVTKRYPNGYEGVSQADFVIEDGEFFILVGPSGCGKSTLLNMIVGLEDITEGTLTIGDRVVNDLGPKDRNLAMVFQNYALYPHMTVRENMAFPLKMQRLPQDEIDKRVDDAARVLELAELLDRKPSDMSGGQRQRVAMGRAIVRQPDVFLFDEPLSNLDAKLRGQMRIEIARLQKRYATTTIYVTHDQVEAMTLADRVAVMRKGVVQQVASPRELYNNPINLFVAGFIGSPSMNFLAGTLADGVLDLGGVRVALPPTVLSRIPSDAPTKVVAGIRPEHFEDASLVAHDDADDRPVMKVTIDVVEWMGSELYVHFQPPRGGTVALGEVAEELGDGDEATSATTQSVTARLDPTSMVEQGETAELWLDARRILLFDPESGDNILYRAKERAAATV